MKTILLEQLWTAKKSIFFWSLALAGSSFLVIELYDSMATQFTSAFEESGMPAGFEAFFGNMSAFSSPAGWLGLEMYSLMLPISLAIVGISAGSSAVGREENSGTLELLLSSPISRSRLMIEKLTAVTLQLFIIAFAVWVTIALSKYFLNYDINLQDAALATLSAFLVGLVFACSAAAIQAISGSRSLAIGICSGILIVAYFVDSLAPLVDVMDSIKHASVFYYYDGQEALLGDGNVINSVILFAASLILAALAVFSFDKRDIGI